MEYYMFKVNAENSLETSSKMGKIKYDNAEYIKYNQFLKANYGTTVTENEDYIPLLLKNEVIMVLAEILFEQNDLENVFEVMFDELYKSKGGDKFEENTNCEWLSQIG